MKAELILMLIMTLRYFLLAWSKFFSFIFEEELNLIKKLEIVQTISFRPAKNINSFKTNSSGFKVGGGGGGRSLSEIRTPADPKGPPFVLFWDIHFWLTLKIFWRHLWRKSSILILRGSARRKNANFWSKFVPENFFSYFFSKICLQRRKFG